MTSRTRSSAGEGTLAISATSMPWADSSTIWARRQVTTDPDARRTMRSSRFPSSSETSRPQAFPRHHTSDPLTPSQTRMRDRACQVVDLEGQGWLTRH